MILVGYTQLTKTARTIGFASLKEELSVRYIHVHWAFETLINV